MSPDERAIVIEDAAYKVLDEKGFKGTSMLAVARAAKASNETMYKWYGDKIGLFSAMIARNTRAVEAEMDRVRASGGVGLDALNAVGHALLAMVTGPRAVALNRAAAADVSGVLGAALAAGGREKVAPLVARLLHETYGDNASIRELADVYLSLLLGDLQVRRVIGVLPPLSPEEVTARANRAMTLFMRLYPI